MRQQNIEETQLFPIFLFLSPKRRAIEALEALEAGGELPSAGGLMPLNLFMEGRKTSVLRRAAQETVCPC
ncbi:MAG TPA: hypothetical protein V6D25_25845 [Leptolyngbyaceae cyanobacterium]